MFEYCDLLWKEKMGTRAPNRKIIERKDGTNVGPQGVEAKNGS